MAAKRFFEHIVTVTIGATNMQKTAYWAKYCEWFGEARELFMLNLLSLSAFSPPEGMRLDEVFEQFQVALETADLNIRFLRPTYFGDRISIRINTRNFTENSVMLVADFLKGEEVVAHCRQTIVFFNPVNGERIPIPEFLRTPALEFQVEAAPAQ
ncbi:MAG: thioesterase family protein [Candidatus Buchananbacteria bacterium]